ncbi:MAG: hypothetical protein A3H57_00240 [Candidatus Taylorbacteria bacterium RIFCSPLOWO2_02_FULL_43_11]|uniref:Glucosamine/galactosamine-6-phosphate isomerase domain-containing protein n=1 Tax=Candidatus Taylorbacteria bacterium RIFCSPHIGHO2_02_FULL_43_32b TaxID=1802306 RepID=A0A1G2MF40_9BACT|nr:MAG: hypothetical protein A2743_00675 [Candidatus Taylorbacteria bacterium RIFCSPHIGHO2_01_FULL_43_47]OHA22508.1 MAG: hypothetical protein A3C72_00230 [Candidatus Taylorbacteria bacterium RIFCSPHIGHO2_02_FULL_43_32b]OHA35903.1 MAG: hypothetical protein A3H57_00240 [Candidatus Taylorbacteria bacterium RIFCSPLOWO2_02_FULL_43_11]
MNFIPCIDSKKGEADLGEALIKALKSGKRTLWTLPGGTNVPIANSVLRKIKEILSESELKNLVIMQCDERYGPKGHKDSNWAQLLDLHFPIENIENYPLLVDLPLLQTAEKYGEIVKEQFKKAEIIIGQFGIGADGHIAGILPKSPALKATKPVVGYEKGGAFTRLSITPNYLLQITEAYVFAFGPSKREAIQKLKNNKESVENLPAILFYEIPKVNFYTDQV